MSKQDDQILIEAVKTHRERLRGAFLFGSLGSRRTAPTLVTRLCVSIVLAAVICAGCAGTSFVTTLLRDRAAQQQMQQQQNPPSPVPEQPAPEQSSPPVPAGSDSPQEEPSS